jgi:pyruvate/2-oxoglutarate dehydrogenase complex dihydrolipoamide dehydrogenase (E3) component
VNDAPRVLVIGGGPAGITAALQASELGARVTLLEAGLVGDSTLHRGPPPVRTVARAARLARDWSSWADFDLTGGPPVPDLPAVVANVDTERVSMAAQMICSDIGIGRFPRVWSDLGAIAGRD